VRPTRSYSRLRDEGDQSRPNLVKGPLPEGVQLGGDEGYRKRGRSSSAAESDPNVEIIIERSKGGVREATHQL
jgi:hypothetical protein